MTSCWMCARISSSGSFSSAERLISSISRRCSRTLASSSLSVSSGLDGCGRRPARLRGSGEHRPGHAVERRRRLLDGRRRLRSGAASGGEAAGHARCRSASDACSRQRASDSLSFLARPSAAGAARLGGVCGSISFFSCVRDLVAGLDLVERHAAVDRLAHQPVIVRDAGRRSDRRAPARCRSCAGRDRTSAARSG